jgi:ribosomal protein L37AE/L43A
MNDLHRAPGVEGAGQPLQSCPNCAAYIIAATWSEQVSERCVRDVWSCESCGFEFETSAYFPVQRIPNRSGD